MLSTTLSTLTRLPARLPQVRPLPRIPDEAPPGEESKTSDGAGQTGELSSRPARSQLAQEEMEAVAGLTPEERKKHFDERCRKIRDHRRVLLGKQYDARHRVYADYTWNHYMRRQDRQRGASLFPKRRGSWGYCRSLYPSSNDRSTPFWWPVPWHRERGWWQRHIPEVPFEVAAY